MTTHNQTSNLFSFAKFGDLLFVRQRPVANALTHRGFFAGLGDRFTAWRERRVAYAELAALSDRELADIGLTRQQIPQVLAGKR